MNHIYSDLADVSPKQTSRVVCGDNTESIPKVGTKTNICAALKAAALVFRLTTNIHSV